jgi:ATP/ADP translocase
MIKWVVTVRIDVVKGITGISTSITVEVVLVLIPGKFAVIIPIQNSIIIVIIVGWITYTIMIVVELVKAINTSVRIHIQ